MAFNGHGGHDFGFQLVRNASLLGGQCSCSKWRYQSPSWVETQRSSSVWGVRTIPMERDGATDMVHATARRIAFVIAELHPMTELQPRGPVPQGDIAAVYLEGVDITMPQPNTLPSCLLQVRATAQ